MTTLSAHPFMDGFVFLEGPRWHADRLWVSDMFGKRVFRLSLDGKAEPVATVAGRPAGLGFLPDGTPLVVSMLEHRVYRIAADGGLTLYADLSHIATGPLNEMVVDARGNAYVGNMGFDMFSGAAPAPARLAVVAPDGAVRVVADDLMFPNGTAITADGATLIVAETFAARLTAFDIGPDGSLANRRVWAQLGQEFTPDGICLDSEGAAWVGNPLVNKFIRVREGGEILAEVPTPGRWAVACAFGGADRSTLFCLSAETTLEDQPKGISRAVIETLQPGVTGAGVP